MSRHNGLPGYDAWKTRSDLDDAPNEPDGFDECDECGEPSDDMNWRDGRLLCHACFDAEDEDDEAADRGDWECHQERDQ